MVNSRCKGKIFLVEYKMKSCMFFQKMKQYKQKKEPLPLFAASLATGRSPF